MAMVKFRRTRLPTTKGNAALTDAQAKRRLIRLRRKMAETTEEIRRSRDAGKKLDGYIWDVVGYQVLLADAITELDNRDGLSYTPPAIRDTIRKCGLEGKLPVPTIPPAAMDYIRKQGEQAAKHSARLLLDVIDREDQPLLGDAVGLSRADVAGVIKTLRGHRVADDVVLLHADEEDQE